MVKMRGGNSRLELLRNLESPKQRNELSQLTGIDWKEVDRQVNLLHSYGLVSVYAETGSVKIYKLTEQGQLILKLIGELNGLTIKIYVFLISVRIDSSLLRHCLRFCSSRWHSPKTVPKG